MRILITIYNILTLLLQGTRSLALKYVYWNHNIFRFANLLKFEKIQSVVKTIKIESPLDLSCTSEGMLANNDILSRLKAMEQMQQIEPSYQINDTLTNEELKSAGEMFLYLVMCPNTIRPWLAFYKDLFQTQSPDKIILTLNRLIKGSVTATKGNKYFKKIAQLLLQRIQNMLPGRITENTESRPQKFEGI